MTRISRYRLGNTFIAECLTCRDIKSSIRVRAADKWAREHEGKCKGARE